MGSPSKDGASAEEAIQRKGLDAIRIDPSLKKYPTGIIKRVTHEDIKALLMKTEARIMCADYMVFTNDVQILIKYLSELKEYDLAINLAIAFDTLVSYPAALMLRDYQLMIAG
jgi:hypothetical protein